MNRKFPIWAVVVIVLSVLVAVIGLSFIAPYNKIVALQETVEEKQGNIQSQLQARVDKINEMIPVVSAALDHDSTLAEELADLQDSLNSGQITPHASLSQLEKISDLSGTVMNDFSAILQKNASSENVLSDYLISVEGIENRISVARMRYNEAVSEYNSYIRRFPHNIVAGLFGFEQIASFGTDSSS